MAAAAPLRRKRFLPSTSLSITTSSSSSHFEPNIKSNAPADISDAYMEHELPGFVWNFQRVGYKLIGGRVDHLTDGTPVAYTFYRGDNGTILCTYMKSHGLQPPPGELQQPDQPSGYAGEHHYYQYKGYRVCLSYPRSGCICILVTQQPMQEVHTGHRRLPALALPPLG